MITKGDMDKQLRIEGECSRELSALCLLWAERGVTGSTCLAVLEIRKVLLITDSIRHMREQDCRTGEHK